MLRPLQGQARRGCRENPHPHWGALHHREKILPTPVPTRGCQATKHTGEKYFLLPPLQGSTMMQGGVGGGDTPLTQGRAGRAVGTLTTRFPTGQCIGARGLPTAPSLRRQQRHPLPLTASAFRVVDTPLSPHSSEPPCAAVKTLCRTIVP